MSVSPERGGPYLSPIINAPQSAIRGPHVHTLIKRVTQVGMYPPIRFNGYQTRNSYGLGVKTFSIWALLLPRLVVKLRHDHIKTTRLQRMMAEIGRC